MQAPPVPIRWRSGRRGVFRIGEGKVIDPYHRRSIPFYSGEGTDDRGRTLADIQALDPSRMEYFHDFIQWMFPLRDPSRYNPGAPVLTDADIAAFQDRRSFANLRRFPRPVPRVPGPGVLRRRGPRGQEKAGPTAQLFAIPNHNWLRITRVLLCLDTLGLDEECRAFFSVSRRHPRTRGGRVGRDLGYWRDAAREDELRVSAESTRKA